MKIFSERKNQITISLNIIVFIFIIDLITKYLAVEHLKGKEALSFLNNFFVLIYAENTGAFLGFGKDWNIYVKYIIFLVIPIILCIFVLLHLMFKEKLKHRIIIGSCIIGGGIGNLVDRLFNNFTVIDFMNFGIGNIRTGILNFADLPVTFGIFALIIFEIILDRKRKGNNKQ